jgi:hypothetical protein
MGVRRSAPIAVQLAMAMDSFCFQTELYDMAVHE